MFRKTVFQDKIEYIILAHEKTPNKGGYFIYFFTIKDFCIANVYDSVKFIATVN